MERGDNMSLDGTSGAKNVVRGKINGLETIHGYSAYEIAVINGFKGTEEEWLESITNDAADMLKDELDEAKELIERAGEIEGTLEDADKLQALRAIIEGNKNYNFSVWIGTTEQYNALAEIKENCLYLLTDDTAVNDIETKTEAIADYVVEQGKVGVWNYRKWNSGIAECWAYEEYENISFSNALDGGYSSGDISTELPISFINGASDTSIQGNANKFYIVGGAWIKDNFLYFDVLSLQNTTSNQVDVRWYVIGKWK